MAERNVEATLPGKVPERPLMVATEVEKATRSPKNLEKPICCQLVPQIGLFQVLRAKGKTLSSGGFGVSMATGDGVGKSQNLENGGVENCELGTSEMPPRSSSKSKGSEKEGGIEPQLGETESTPEDPSIRVPETKANQSFGYLFVEDVVFLFERGLLECSNSDSSPLTSSQLYQLLPKMGMSLAMYFVYAHLRSQDFRVLRYYPGRLPVLRRQQDNGLTKSEHDELKRAVRKSIQDATIPAIPEDSLNICWEAYKPNTQFAKTRPGIPDFYVAVTYYNRPSVPFSIIHSLMQKCDRVPLKLAMVSDSGAVVMFGVSPDGVPTMNNKVQN